MILLLDFAQLFGVAIDRIWRLKCSAVQDNDGTFDAMPLVARDFFYPCGSELKRLSHLNYQYSSEIVTTICVTTLEGISFLIFRFQVGKPRRRKKAPVFVQKLFATITESV